MTAAERAEVLSRLDLERQTIVYPGVTRSLDTGVTKDLSADGKNCEIVYSSCSEDEVDRVINHQIQAARSAPYELEWKLYGHDNPRRLGDRLAAAGFEVGEREAFMVFIAAPETMDRIGPASGNIRPVRSKEALRDVRTIVEEVHGKNCAKQFEQYEFMLENHPHNMSIYVAYVNGEPAACGRVYFHQRSRFAALYGGQTRERFRKRGLFTQIVAVRIHEAISRGAFNVCVDALPTSEPIFRKLGFETLTYTQPFCYSGGEKE